MCQSDGSVLRVDDVDEQLLDVFRRRNLVEGTSALSSSDDTGAELRSMALA